MASEQVPLYDCLIIGGGIAGLSAALSLIRTLHSAVVIPTWDSHEPKRFREEAKLNILTKYSTVEFADVKLKKIIQIADGENAGRFCVLDEHNRRWLGRKVILAMGVEDNLPDIPGFKECWPHGIFHCLVHRGYEQRGCASAGVLAIDGDANFHAARHLAFQARNLSSMVTVYINGNTELANEVESQLGPCGFKADAWCIVKFVQQPQKAQLDIHFDDGNSEVAGFLVHCP